MELQAVKAAMDGALGLLDMEEDEINIIHGTKRTHRYWSIPYLAGRTDPLQRNTFSKLHRYMLELDLPDEFRATLRMSPELYTELLSKVYPLILRKDTNFRECIKPEERLDITLRYLAHGDCVRTLNQGNLVGKSTVLPIVRDTCAAIIAVLRRDYMSVPSTEEEWLNVADGFAQHWQVPHCLGAIDGKHIRVRKPRSSGSLYLNYKKYFSVVLMAVVDADYRFLYVDIGTEGRTGDSRIWKDSSMYSDLNDAANPLSVPKASKIVGIRHDLPYYMLGDDAFALNYNLMKPYAVREQGQMQIAHNYRLSRGRRVVENAFGILATRFRLFLREQDMEPEGVKLVVMAACCLHNYLRTRSGHMYTPPGSVDWEDREHNVVRGEWRRDGRLDGLDKSHKARNMPHSAKAMRDSLCQFYSSRHGMVPWQNKYLEKKRLEAEQEGEEEDDTSGQDDE